MDEFLKVVIPGVLGLTGVLAGLAIGYYKWRLERRDATSSGYVRDRRQAYRILFEKLESAHLKLRAEEVDQSAFAALIFDLNSHLLKAAIYLDPEDRELANSYLNSLYRLKELVGQAESKDATRNWEVSVLIPPEVMEAKGRLGEAQDQAERLRAQIVKKVRKVLRQ